ncbi:hypothetical protein ACE7GA_06910 [Roseomonas sp. CCTCC AB2023176]|uniref:hypothetical protein n=1 Tax=Roseomonas sp. CCTCC AB2023176 TaxID=3342640 RepID=UPI0035E1B67B
MVHPVAARRSLHPPRRIATPAFVAAGLAGLALLALDAVPPVPAPARNVVVLVADSLTPPARISLFESALRTRGFTVIPVVAPSERLASAGAAALSRFGDLAPAAVGLGEAGAGTVGGFDAGVVRARAVVTAGCRRAVNDGPFLAVATGPAVRCPATSGVEQVGLPQPGIAAAGARSDGMTARRAAEAVADWLALRVGPSG